MADTTRPRGTLFGPINFAPAATNPYGLTVPGNFASPSLIDIDGDGDLDALIGNRVGNTLLQLNTGSATLPAFAAASTNPYGLVDVGYFANPSFVDIDGDGDLDALIGNGAGNTLVQLNTGSSAVPAFAAASTNPYGLANAGFYTIPSFVDIDGDGDLDALIGNRLGNTVVQLNTGSATSPAFAAASTNPYSLGDVGSSASPELVDIDGDGVLDAFIGTNSYGNILVQLNTGTTTSPAFAAASINPYGLVTFGNYSSPNFVDIDSDGDLDALVGNSAGTLWVQLNTANPVIAITPTTANGRYGVGSVISFTIAFNEAVIVNTAGGTPSIALETGATDRAATYTSGSGTGTLTFSYTVRAGDTSADLDVISASALKLNGGTIRDAAGNNAILTLAAPGAAGSLGANANIVIDGTAPRGALPPTPAFAATTTNPYGLADVGFYASPGLVDIDGDGDLDALIGNSNGNTLVQLNTGSATGPAFAAATTNPYGLADVGLSASPSLVDIDGDGDLDALIGNDFGNTLVQVNTGSATSPAFAAATTNPYGLADVGLGASPNMVDIDGDGDLDALIGQRYGNTLVQLNTGSATSPAFAAPTTNPYSLSNVGSFASPSFVDIDGDGDLDALIGNSIGNTVVQLNTGNRVAPVTATTANGIYGVGSMITLTVAFNEAVIVTGTPTLLLETGAVDRNATYASGSGTSTLTFSYTVQAGDTSADLDQASSSALALNSGTIRDAAGNNAILALAAPGAAGSLGANKALVIDGTPPAVSSVTSSTADAAYKVGDIISIQVNFSEVVTVIGAPSLALETGPTDRAAVYASGSGTATLTFTYTVRAGDTSADLDVVNASALKLNGGTLRDAAGNNAVLTLAAPGAAGSLGANKAIVIDGAAPLGALIVFAVPTLNPYGIANVSAVARSSLVDIDGDGDLDALIGNFDGNTLVRLNTGSATAPAFGTAITNAYGLGDVGNSASPSFVDIDGDGDLDALIGNTAGNTLVRLNTGSATAAAFGTAFTNAFGLGDVGNYASPSFVDIDGDGDLDALTGNSNGNTLLRLNTGSATAPAFAAATPNPYGLGNVGAFANPSFVDIDGDGDLDALIGNNAGDTLVRLNTGSATAAAFGTVTTNPYGLVNVGLFASPRLVDIDGDSDLDAWIGNSDGNILVQLNNTVAPVNSGTANGTYGVGSVITLTVAFNENVLVTGTPTLQLETGTIDRNATYAGGSGTNTLTFTYTVQAGDTSADLDQLSNTALALSGGTIRDAAGNNAILALAAPGAAGSLGANKAIVIDGIAPTVAITSNVPAVKAGETATVTFTFSEDPGASFTAGDITTTGGTLGAISGAGLTRAATFTPAVNTTANASITVANLSYTDAAGNTGSAGATPTIAIDTLAPTVAITSNVAAVKIGETATITFTFSEDPGGSFSDGDIFTTGGTLGAFSGAGLTRTATFTPAVNTTANASITVANATYNDTAGNSGAAGTTPALAVDTTRPALASAITISNPALKIGDTATVTFTFTEAVTGFTTADLTVGNGVVSTLATADGGITWTATLTPSANAVAAVNTVTLDNTGITDLAGNAGVATTVSNTYAVETTRPLFTSAAASGTTLVMNYSDASNLDAVNRPANTAFAVTTGGNPNAVTAVAVNAAAKTVTLTLTTPILFGEAVFVTYNDPTAGNDVNAIQDAVGNDAATLTATSVVNNTGAPPPPAPEPSLDADNDGVPTAQENLVRPLTPTGLTGDGNGDGALDSAQINVVSAPVPNSPNRFITVVADANKGITDIDPNQAVITNFAFQAPPTGLPNGANLPNPISFNAAIGGAGQTETFSIFVDAATNPNGYWIKTANGAWNNIATAIETVGDKVRIDFAITDGGVFDADGIANGSIAVTGGAGNLPLSLIGQPPDLPPGGQFWF